MTTLGLGTKGVMPGDVRLREARARRHSHQQLHRGFHGYFTA